MDRLWSPWRLSYVTGSGGSPSGCIFCDAATRCADPAQEALVLARGGTCYVILNLYPYNNGHLMVVPKRHISSLVDGNPDELSEIMQLTRDAEAALLEAYEPQGINIGINLGRAAGAGIPNHLHVHLVPRWTGDTNFMPVIGETRVLPEDLGASAARLRPVFERLIAARA